MYEPLFDQVRTRDQFGYHVACDSRWTDGIIGAHVKVVSASKSAEEIDERVERFLIDFREILSNMSRQEFLENVNGLAKQKLEAFNSMSEQTGHYWSEIRDRRYEFQSEIDEVIALRRISKSEALEAYDKWFYPIDSKTRRRFSVKIVSVESLISEAPNLNQENCNDFNDENVKLFQETCKQQMFDRMY